jgi:hypothetical protein
MGITLAEDRKLELFKSTANNIFLSTSENLEKTLCGKVVLVFDLNQALSLSSKVL